VSETVAAARSDSAFTVETIHLDLPPLVGALGRRLHEAGLPVTPERAAHFADALTLVEPISRRRLYWTARAVFVTGAHQVPAFDAVFSSVFAAPPRAEGEEFVPEHIQTVEAPPDERPASDHKSSTRDANQPRDPAAAISASPAKSGEDEDEGEELEVPLAMASDEERLGRASFDALEPHELALLYRMMSRLELATPMRRTRRRERGRHGEHVDVRRTLRASLRTGGDPIRLARRRRRIVPRRLVLLCDISGSMEPYARAYLQFLTCGARSGPGAEAFVFATRLTRVTRSLATRSPEQAIRRAVETAPDWSSGTRIGEALGAFNDRHGRRGMARGAVIVILSDGWERGDPMRLGREMERLSRFAHRIVWVNPRVSASGFSVQAGGMVVALPYCHALVSGHSVEALGEVIDAIGVESPRERDWSARRWTVPAALDDLPAEEEPWGSAIPVRGSSVAMPSGYGPSRGNTTSGWANDDEEGAS
jgi:uncharacterized protein with von Willebrand factor type A (vWA) domain